MTKPAQHGPRTVKMYEGDGYLCGRVERWVPVAGNWARGKRVDLFGLFDWLAVPRIPHPADAPVVGIQVCSMSGRAAHEKSMRANPNLDIVLDAGWHVHLVAWKRKNLRTKAGGTKVRWISTIVVWP